MAEAIVSMLSERLTCMLADKIFQEVSLVTKLREDVESICNELDSIKILLNDVREMTNSSSMTNWLHKVQDFLYRAVDLVEECEGRKFRNPFIRRRMGRRIQNLRKSISDLHSSAKYLKYLKSALDVSAHFHALNAKSEDRREKSNAVPTESRTVGMKEETGRITEWIRQEGFAVLAVVGIGGLGKTLLLQKVLDDETVRQRFDHVVWLAVSQKYIVKELLLEMGKQIKVPIKSEVLSGLVEDTLRDIIHKHLESKCCLLVLDDVWAQDAFKHIGLHLESGDNKIVVTTRDKRVGDAMGASDHTHEMEYLTDKNCMELFCIHAFPDREKRTPPKALKSVSNQIVQKCRGLPLAIATIAESLARVERIPNKWESIRDRLNQADALTGTVMPSLRLSYHALPYHLKSCFMYCSIFPKNTEMRTEFLVYSWIAEGFISTQNAAEAYDIGLSYIQELADRCLLKVSHFSGDGRIQYCKIHDLLHDLAVSESQAGTKCLIKPGENLKELPAKECLGLRRISLVKNDIGIIKDAIQCPNLRTLWLWHNINLASISRCFFNKLKYLVVLDLSQTSIESLPRSISNLTHLKFLNLSRTNIVKLPSSLSALWRLQFLDVSWCKHLTRLHSGIGKHKFMLHLNVKRCKKLESLPAGVAKLSSLQILKGAVFRIGKAANVLQLADLKNLTLLQHLSLTIHPPSSQENAASSSQAPSFPIPEAPSFEIPEGTFTGMTKLRTVSFRSIPTSRLILPTDMKSISERLEHVRLHNCLVPEWIFDLQNLMVLVIDGNISGADYRGLEKLPNLRKLRFSRNRECEEFPAEFGASTAFPNLKKLMIEDFESLKRFPLLQDNALPRLQYLRIIKCNQVINMIEEFERLKTLNEVEIEKDVIDHGQILKNRPVKIKVIDPSKVEEIENIVKVELEKQPSRTMSGPRASSPPEHRGESAWRGLRECAGRGIRTLLLDKK